VNGDTFYREKNVIGYYRKFLSEPIKPYGIVEEVIIEVDELRLIVFINVDPF